MESLWPKLGTISQDVPVQILKAQADIFNKEMNGVLECEVTTNKMPHSRVFVPGIDNDFTAKLIVTNPQLTDYSLVLVQVNNLVSKAYPCEIINCLKDFDSVYDNKANNAEEFKQKLGAILKSEEVVTSLQNLIAQTTDI